MYIVASGLGHTGPHLNTLFRALRNMAVPEGTTDTEVILNFTQL